MHLKPKLNCNFAPFHIIIHWLLLLVLLYRQRLLGTGTWFFFHGLLAREQTHFHTDVLCVFLVRLKKAFHYVYIIRIALSVLAELLWANAQTNENNSEQKERQTNSGDRIQSDTIEK